MRGTAGLGALCRLELVDPIRQGHALRSLALFGRHRRLRSPGGINRFLDLCRRPLLLKGDERAAVLGGDRGRLLRVGGRGLQRYHVGRGIGDHRNRLAYLPWTRLSSEAPGGRLSDDV